MGTIIVCGLGSFLFLMICIVWFPYWQLKLKYSWFRNSVLKIKKMAEIESCISDMQTSENWRFGVHLFSKKIEKLRMKAFTHAYEKPKKAST
jgi:hypothetical protein